MCYSDLKNQTQDVNKPAPGAPTTSAVKLVMSFAGAIAMAIYVF
jgi:hypothetical protein